MTTLTQLLRSTISPAHTMIEKLPISTAMIEGRIGITEYGELLSQLWHLHGWIEDQLSAWPMFQSIFDKTMRRHDLLANDLEAIGLSKPHAIAPVTEQAIEKLRHGEELSPWFLMGCLYVLEGSRMGSMMLINPISQALGVPVQLGVGLDYHLDGLHNRPKSWSQFKMSIDNLSISRDDTEAVIQGAEVLMSALHDIYSVCYEIPTFV